MPSGSSQYTKTKWLTLCEGIEVQITDIRQFDCSHYAIYGLRYLLQAQPRRQVYLFSLPSRCDLHNLA